MHQEIVQAGRNAEVRVYIVWMPMLPSDNNTAAEEMARSLVGENLVHFYDPHRRAGIQFVEDHFDPYMKTALAAMPEDHPWRERLATQAAAPASEKPVWDALLLFAPGVEWKAASPEPNVGQVSNLSGESGVESSSTSPEPDWWTKQVGFSADAAEGEPTGQFWRKGADDVLASDWFDEVREALNYINSRGSP